MATDDRWMYASQVRKRRLNQLWIDLISLLHGLLGLLPGALRNVGYRMMLDSCGRHVFFDRRVYVKFPQLVSIGDRVAVNRGVEFYPDMASRSRISIGNDVYLAPYVRFHASGHDLADLERHLGGDIVIGDGCWLGTGVLVLPGISIGSGTVVGAGSVVTADLPAGVVAVGVPARVIRPRDSTPAGE